MARLSRSAISKASRIGNSCVAWKRGECIPRRQKNVLAFGEINWNDSRSPAFYRSIAIRHFGLKTMRLALVGAALAFAGYAALNHVTYLADGGYSSGFPEHRRIDVRSPQECAEVIARADRTLGPDHGLVCDRVPLARHWFNLAQDAFERRQVLATVANAVRTDAVASTAGLR